MSTWHPVTAQPPPQAESLFEMPEVEVRARARATDPDTSHEAAASVRAITDTHKRVITCLEERQRAGYTGATDEQIAGVWDTHPEWPPISPSGLRSRRAELVKRGLVEDTGTRLETVSGRKTAVWRLTP